MGLSILDTEGPTFDLEEELATPEYIIAGKFYTRRALNMEAIASTFMPLWRSRNGFKVKNMGNHIVLFTFDNKHEVDSILSNEPWSFDKHLLVLQRYDKDEPIEDLKFNSTTFWVQVHDIPVRFMNPKVAEGICSTVGTVVRKSETEMNGGSFMRVRVNVDITRPLSRGRMVSVGQGREKWVSFKYERQPNICYWCGCLNHDDRDCEVWLDSEGSLKVEEQKFGPWLRAPPSNLQDGPLENKLEREVGAVEKNDEPPVGERIASPPGINPHLRPSNNDPDQAMKSRESTQKETFLSEIAEIDEGLSKLKAGPITVTDSLNAEAPINVHVPSEEVKEAARVSQVLESVYHANPRAATTEVQNIPSPRQQGSWKRLNRADGPSKLIGKSNTIESVLSSKRVYEELSNPNGLPSKKRAVSIEIISSKLAEANAQPRLTQ
ncbi:uncharacterized protein LOC115990400 [Quercus lobata]|uniref:uncharacterized protein LOC115990400 n=1 Tax=Quercus lobata TaxID=97700 RepID=UPI00124442A4|nr:uncharacterized protein LOC115990400 [Quercus lobata]